ncbi:aldose epimerase [Xylanimonas ulmi]|uniref:Aldose 1-epimerase n=1 Tax=Xylanimonas ulmi TaxID=228973 RepID=A0A4V2EXV0_9MICO|nr:aldose epimerase [Xylanibacterium ulmi]RZS60760.1 aldose 1-epimerase [Xylanibacterium ulmi]
MIEPLQRLGEPQVESPLRTVGLRGACGWTAEVDLWGGGLRSLRRRGVPLVEEYEVTAGARPPHCSGSVLFPWPNRVRDGLWVHRGHQLALELTEPKRSTANHGLVLDDVFGVVRHGVGDVELVTDVRHRPGYPFTLRLATRYTLSPAGLRVEHLIENLGDDTAPVAIGAHPYVRVGDVPTSSLSVRVDAEAALRVDGRLLPVGWDVLDGRPVLPSPLGGADVNACLRLRPAHAQGARHHVAAPDGRQVVVWTDPDLAYVHVYVCPDLPSDGGPRRALAIEPMSAPPDALRSGEGLHRLEPGATWTVAWGISVG